jgi:hypothetical protein
MFNCYKNVNVNSMSSEELYLKIQEILKKEFTLNANDKIPNSKKISENYKFNLDMQESNSLDDLLELNILFFISLSNHKNIETFFNLYKELTLQYYQLGVVILKMINHNNFIGVPPKTVELLFIDNLFTIKIFLNVLNNLPNSDHLHFYYMPNINYILNTIFKFPDKISNFLKSSFINYKEYYTCLITNLFIEKMINSEIAEKISKLKLIPILIDAIKTLENENFSADMRNYLQNLNEMFSETMFYEDFIYDLFTSQINGQNEFNNLNILVTKLEVRKEISEFFQEYLNMMLNYNINSVALILLSGNSNLINAYISSIFNFLNNKIESLDSFPCIMIFVSITFYLQHINDQDNKSLINIYHKVLKSHSILLEKITNKSISNIVVIFGEYIKNQLSQHLKMEKENEPNELLKQISEEEKNLINFREISIHLENNPLYLSKLKKLYLNIYLNQEPKTDQIKKPVETNKTKYLSVKFQKKYGTFKSEGKILEFDDKKQTENDSLKILNIKQGLNLKISLKTEEDFSDLKPISCPIYLKDCLLGLASEFPDRVQLSLENLPSLIDSQPFDLDFFLPRLSEALLKLNDNSGLENFDTLVEMALIRLTVYDPTKMTQILCQRFFREESGVKNKFQILSIIEKAVEEISEFYKSSKKIPKVNKLHLFFDNIIYPLLSNLQTSKIDKLLVLNDIDYLIAKFVVLISKLLKFSENHPFIYKALFETFELFKSIHLVSTPKSLTMIESMNFYSSVILKFLDKSFLEIYPEYFSNVKTILQFLNKSHEEVVNEQIKLSILKTLNDYLVNLEKLKISFRETNNDLLI